MQNNINKTLYINNLKVINIKSEMLFREAEDDLFYFNKMNNAQNKLKKAIELTPFHHKSLMLLGDIYFMKGSFKKAFECYSKLNQITANDFKVLAAMSNCFYSLKNFKNALLYCDKAIPLFKGENYTLYSQLLEIKISSLWELKQYKKALYTYKKLNKNFEFINCKLLKEKLEIKEKVELSCLNLI